MAEAPCARRDTALEPAARLLRALPVQPGSVHRVAPYVAVGNLRIFPDGNLSLRAIASRIGELNFAGESCHSNTSKDRLRNCKSTMAERAVCRSSSSIRSRAARPTGARKSRISARSAVRLRLICAGRGRAANDSGTTQQKRSWVSAQAREVGAAGRR